MKSGVLFDVDGTLVDTTYLHTVGCWEALRQHGVDVSMAKIHRAIGMGSDKLLDHLLDQPRDRDDDEQISIAHDVLYGAWWERLRPLPGATELLRAVAERDLAVVLASSAKEPELHHLRQVLGTDDVITAATSSSDAEQSKPAPDILQAAIEQSGVDPRAAGRHPRLRDRHPAHIASRRHHHHRGHRRQRLLEASLGTAGSTWSWRP